MSQEEGDEIDSYLCEECKTVLEGEDEYEVVPVTTNVGK